MCTSTLHCKHKHYNINILGEKLTSSNYENFLFGFFKVNHRVVNLYLVLCIKNM